MQDNLQKAYLQCRGLSTQNRNKRIATSEKAVYSFWAIILFIFFISCEHIFEPLQESDQHHFSIYGYLDASADTQWVRVMPLRIAVNQLPGISDVTVTLYHEGSDNRAVMEDSLFQFFHGASAWNFWTTMTIEPEESYRLVAEYTDDRSSSANVTIPPDFPVPVFDNFSNIVRIMDIEHLADVQTRYVVRLGQPVRDHKIRFPYREHISPYSPTEYRVLLRPSNDMAYLNEFYSGGEILERKIFIAAAGPGWPDFVALDDIVETLPDGISNIENGVGYLAGIISKEIPMMSCYDESGNLIACPEFATVNE